MLDGRPLEPFRYRDFGSLVSLGEYRSLTGIISDKNLFIEGLFARFMYRSLYKTHEMVLHGPWKVVLDTLSRMLTRRTEPQVKLH
jgi:NADH dehydrogenase